MNTDLKELGVPGYVHLRLKAEDTEQNNRVYNAFKQLAAEECRNDYTLTLRKLLEFYETDAKTEQLWYVIKMLEERVIALETAKTEPKKEIERGLF